MPESLIVTDVPSETATFGRTNASRKVWLVTKKYRITMSTKRTPAVHARRRGQRRGPLRAGAGAHWSDITRELSMPETLTKGNETQLKCANRVKQTATMPSSCVMGNA